MIVGLRDHLRTFGVPVDELSDAELREAVERFGAAAAASGISAREAAANMAAACRAMR